MTLSEQKNRLADLLEQVVDGKLNSGGALKSAESWKDMQWEQREVNVAWHTLMHFNTDEDIRQKDAEYDAGLRQQLVKHHSQGHMSKRTLLKSRQTAFSSTWNSPRKAASQMEENATNRELSALVAQKTALIQ